MSAKPDAVSQTSQPAGESGKGFIKRNPWVLLVGVFAVLIVVGIVVS